MWFVNIIICYCDVMNLLNAIVVSIRVGDYNTHQVLMDNGSSADILYYPAFQQMRIERERLVPTNAPHKLFS